MNVGLVAGESSGDTLGAALIHALRARVPNVKCFGVAGPKMIAAGCEAWASADELAVIPALATDKGLVGTPGRAYGSRGCRFESCRARRGPIF